MENLTIECLKKQDTKHRKELEELIIHAFPQAYSEKARDEVKRCLEEGRVSLKALFNGELVGFVGAIPQYGQTGWELHPLVVDERFRGMGIGKKLVMKLEEELFTRGGITIYLGTDDEFSQTSLSDTDLYLETYKKIEEVRNLNHHAYEFYEKIGYKIVGVIPDANGYGKPDIFMAKRIGEMPVKGRPNDEESEENDRQI